jgi:DNA-binding HxlR family transcriptional regulator
VSLSSSRPSEIDQVMEPKDGDQLSLGFMATGEIDDGNSDFDYCPHFQHALELIGRRWTGSILKIIGDRSLRFSEIRSDVPGLSDRLLDARLTELEDEGVVCRIERNGEVSYAATAKGVALRPAFDAIGKWTYEFPMEARPDVLPGRRS